MDPPVAPHTDNTPCNSRAVHVDPTAEEVSPAAVIHCRVRSTLSTSRPRLSHRTVRTATTTGPPREAAKAPASKLTSPAASAVKPAPKRPTPAIGSAAAKSRTDALEKKRNDQRAGAVRLAVRTERIPKSPVAAKGPTTVWKASDPAPKAPRTKALVSSSGRRVLDTVLQAVDCGLVLKAFVPHPVLSHTLCQYLGKKYLFCAKHPVAVAPRSVEKPHGTSSAPVKAAIPSGRASLGVATAASTESPSNRSLLRASAEAAARWEASRGRSGTTSRLGREHSITAPKAEGIDIHCVGTRRAIQFIQDKLVVGPSESSVILGGRPMLPGTLVLPYPDLPTLELARGCDGVSSLTLDASSIRAKVVGTSTSEKYEDDRREIVGHIATAICGVRRLTALSCCCHKLPHKTVDVLLSTLADSTPLCGRLRALELTDIASFTDDDVRELHSFRGLTTLRLTNSDRITDAGFAGLSASLPNLTSVSLGAVSGITAASIAELSRLPHLTTLCVRHCRTLIFTAVRLIAAMTQLRHLEIADCSGIDAPSLSQLRTLRVLERFTFVGSAFCEDDPLGCLFSPAVMDQRGTFRFAASSRHAADSSSGSDVESEAEAEDVVVMPPVGITKLDVGAFLSDTGIARMTQALRHRLKSATLQCVPPASRLYGQRLAGHADSLTEEAFRHFSENCPSLEVLDVCDFPDPATASLSSVRAVGLLGRVRTLHTVSLHRFGPVARRPGRPFDGVATLLATAALELPQLLVLRLVDSGVSWLSVHMAAEEVDRARVIAARPASSVQSADPEPNASPPRSVLTPSSGLGQPPPQCAPTPRRQDERAWPTPSLTKLDLSRNVGLSVDSVKVPALMMWPHLRVLTTAF